MIFERHELVGENMGDGDGKKGKDSGAENGAESKDVEVTVITRPRAGEGVEGVDEEYTGRGWHHAWPTVLGGFLVQFCGFAYCTSFGVFQDYYTRIYLSEASPSAISWIGSVSAFLSIALSVATGPLYDRGYFYHLLYGGCFLMSFSLFMTSLAKPNQLYQVFLAQGVGYGLGSGLAYLPTVAVVSQHFSGHNQPLAMILVHSGSSVGAIVHPLLLNKLLGNPGRPFGTTVRASAGLNTGLLAIACLVMREGRRLGGKGPQRVLERERPRLGDVLRGCLWDGPFVVFALSSFTFATGIWFPGFYLQLSAIMHGIPQSFWAYIFTIMNSVGLLGTLLPTFMLHRIRIDFTFIMSAIVIASSVFAMIGLKDLAISLS